MEITYLDKDQVLSCLPDRRADAHKGNFGRILLICGSKGYTGAAALAAMGALRSGAGLVYLAVPECIYHIEAIKLTEPIILPMPDEHGKLSHNAVGEIKNLLPQMDAVLIGPGLGKSEGVYSVVDFVLKEFCGPVVIDADGINVIAEHKYILRGRQAPTIITPHPGEFRRLSELSNNRANSPRMLAKDLDLIVVLKGYETVITDGSSCYINTTGNPGMAVGGSGDVLAGMITSLIGQGLTPLDAARCGVWLHGAAGDICAREIGQYGMLPTDVVNALPRLMK